MIRRRINMQEIREKLTGFLGKFFNVESIDDDSNIFEMGYVNSLFAMQFVLFIEKEFDVSIGPADMDRDNFSTIRKMIELIKRKSK